MANVSGICPGYASLACVDGSCPIALSEVHPDYDIGAPSSCRECIYSSGDCDECMFQYTEYCVKNNGGDENA